MTDEPVRDREDDTDEIQEKALNDEPDREAGSSEPLADDDTDE